MVKNTDLAEWRSALSIGDEIALHTYHPKRYDIRKITKITKTQIVVGHWRFRKNTGLAIGQDIYSSTEIIPVTQEIRESVRRESLLHSLRNIAWANYSTETLQDILELLSQELKEKLK